ncbi:MAG: Erythronate-4-phosphate dehydrogenase [bacterium]|nr:Erythronate-4-phosphate dehydrogenase [bacterium]
MRILADRNIPFAVEVFSQFGHVRLASGREITPEMVREAEILVVRSVTRVDSALLEGSPVRFVGTATIGTDHIDLRYLKERGIVFADAAGSNATSVAEYVTAALLYVEQRDGISFEGKTLGVVGVGNVGSRVVRKGLALGMKVLRNDPPRAEREGPTGFVDLERVLVEADVVTLHTPLERGGAHPTFHLIGEAELSRLKPGSLLLNTARGAVVDNPALLRALKGGRLAGAVLDVWENEPDPDVDLVARTRIATPHIAGYSFDGKIAGTRMMAEAIGRFLGAPFGWPEGLGAQERRSTVPLQGEGREAVRSAVLSAYPIGEDDARMRGILDLTPPERPAFFDRLRKEYPVRREFHQHAPPGGISDESALEILAALGFVW